MQEDPPPAPESMDDSHEAAAVPKDSVASDVPQTDPTKGPIAAGARVATPQQKPINSGEAPVAPPGAPSEALVPVSASPHQPGAGEMVLQRGVGKSQPCPSFLRSTNYCKTLKTAQKLTSSVGLCGYMVGMCLKSNRSHIQLATITGPATVTADTALSELEKKKALLLQNLTVNPLRFKLLCF